MGTEIHQITGQLTYLLVRDARPLNDSLDVELIVELDTAPVTRFGFKFGEVFSGGIKEIIHHSMMDMLRDAFNNNWQVTLDYVFDSTGRDGIIRQIRIEPPPIFFSNSDSCQLAETSTVFVPLGCIMLTIPLSNFLTDSTICMYVLSSLTSPNIENET